MYPCSYRESCVAFGRRATITSASRVSGLANSAAILRIHLRFPNRHFSPFGCPKVLLSLSTTVSSENRQKNKKGSGDGFKCGFWMCVILFYRTYTVSMDTSFP